VLHEVEQRLHVADRLAACIEDPRSPDQITHSLADIIHFRLLMIAAEDGNDASNLRADSCSRWRCGDLRANALDLPLSYLAAIGDGAEFKNGRQLAASIGSKAILAGSRFRGRPHPARRCGTLTDRDRQGRRNKAWLIGSERNKDR
jgi:hypothetical protein